MLGRQLLFLKANKLKLLFLILVLLISGGYSFAYVDQGALKNKVREVLMRQHRTVGYDVARKFLMGQLHLEQQGSDYVVKDVYCQKDFSARDFRSNPPGPGQIPKETILNTEHTWPQSRFSSLAAKDVQKSDLHHLFPTDSEMNSIRGNNKFGEIEDTGRKLKCSESKLGRDNHGNWIFEPPRNHKGNVARALFYFSIRYQIAIDPQEEAYLRKWNLEDPIDDFERERNDAIAKIQGNRNIFIDNNELVDQIVDF